MTSNDARSTAKDIGSKASGKAAEASESAEKAASAAGGQAKDSAARVADNAQASYAQARDTVSDLSDRLPDAATDALKAGQRAYARSSEHLGRQVAKQPVEALLLAGAIGYLIGWAANRG